MNNAAINSKAIITRVVLYLFSFVTLLVLGVPVQAMGTHDIHGLDSSIMTETVVHEHVKDCAAACGVAERYEEKHSTISRRKKQYEKQPYKPHHPSSNNIQYFSSYRFQTVFLQAQDDIYLKISLFRL